MLTIGEAFDKFRVRLEISPSEQQSASRRQNKIREQLTSDLEVDRDFLTGSYARHTKTKPLKDVDIFVVLSKEKHDFLDRPPIDALTKVRGLLAQHYPEDRVRLGRRSVTVDFGVAVVDDVSDEVVSFDVVPAFAEGEGYRIPDRETGEWIATDPTVHAGLATAANKAFEDRWKPAVKMIKKWNDHQGQPIRPSFLLEVMALKLLDPPWAGPYPRELRHFFASAADRLGEGWPDPAGLGPALSDRLDSSPSMMHEAREGLLRAEKSCTEAMRLERAQQNGAALAVWQTLFGPLFAKS